MTTKSFLKTEKKTKTFSNKSTILQSRRTQHSWFWDSEDTKEPKTVTYLVHKPKIPVLVVKEKTGRQFRPQSQFKWLICLESAESKSFKALKSMLRYVDAENDIINGLTVAGENEDPEDTPVKKAFVEQMNLYEIKNYKFSAVQKGEKSGAVAELICKLIADHLSDDAHYIDFVMLGYNPSKYAFNKESPNTSVDLLRNVICNVYFDH
jgi:hypothetical protein